MSKLNKTSQNRGKQFEENVRLAGGMGQRAAKQDAYALLRRATLASLLWEDLAYETGKENAKAIRNLVPQVDPAKVAALALECRQKQKLRHMPLFLAREMARHSSHNKELAQLLPRIITRADQLTDFVALYFEGGKKQPLTAKVKAGLAMAFHNFDEYQFAKYNRESPIRLRDVLFLSHAKPSTEEQVALFKRIVDNNLKVPDTWEVALSSGSDKKETFTRLIETKKLGGLAFLRNLRNIKDAGVEYAVIKKAFDRLSGTMLLPLNFYGAAKHNPEFIREIEDAMLKSYAQLPKLPGHTVYVVDVSGSMSAPVSGNSTYNRKEVAASLAMLAAETSERVSVYITGSDHQRLGNYRGFGLAEKINQGTSVVGGGGIYTKRVLDFIQKSEFSKGEKPDRIIIFSDSQDCDSGNTSRLNTFAKNNYIVDVSAHARGVNYAGQWTAEVSGWSENFLTFIAALEGIENKFEDSVDIDK